MSRMMRTSEVMEATGLTRATIYAQMAKGNFPRPIKLTERLNGWRSDVIEEWLTSRETATPER